MCISKGISCRPIRQMQRTYTKVMHEIHPNVTRVFERFSLLFGFFFFSNNFRFPSYKYVTFGYPKVHRPTYLIVISIYDLAPNRDSTLMFIYHRHIFVLYIIHQNNPVSKSVRYIIPGILRNRSYRRRALSYRRHPVKLPSSVIWDKFAYRRLAANLSGIIVQKREQIWVCRFGARCTIPPGFFVVNLREIGGRKEARAGKNFSKRAAASAPSWRR